MKKLICLCLVLFSVLGCLSACNFTQNMSGLKDKAESTPKVEEMMTALTEKSTSDAKALMHPQIGESKNAGISQLIDFVNGRSLKSLELTNINFSSAIGTSGNQKQEQTTFKASLSDGDIIYITAVYLSNDAGAGFISFQIVLGAV